MKPEDYKPGNWVLFLGEPKQIEGISNRLRPDCGYFQFPGTTNWVKGIHVQPIPLTEEILVKNGWVKTVRPDGDIRYSHDQSFYDVADHGDKFPFVLESENSATTYYICHSRTVHDFQNALDSLEKEMKFEFKL